MNKSRWYGWWLLASSILCQVRLFIVYQRISLYWKAMIFASDRFVTVSAFVVTVIWIFSAYLMSETDQSGDVKDGNVHQMFPLLIGVSFLISIIFTLYITRKDPSKFSDILSDTCSTSYLMKVFCAEAQFVAIELLRVSEKASSNRNGQQEIFKKSQQLRDNLQMVSCLKVIISKRLLIPPRVFSDVIVRFSVSIYMDRIIKKSFNHKYASDALSGKTGQGDTSNETKILNAQTKAIEDYCLSSYLYMDVVKKHANLFDQFEFLFRTRVFKVLCQLNFTDPDTHQSGLQNGYSAAIA